MSAALGTSGLPADISPVPTVPTTSPSDGSDVARRVVESRERIREAVMGGGRSKQALKTSGARGARVSLIKRIRALPVAGLAVDTVESWWAKHPLHDATAMAGDASRAVMQPIARRNPLTLVFGSLLFGAFLVAFRPWRWIGRSKVFAGLIPQFAALAIKRIPLKAWTRAFKAEVAESASEREARRAAARIDTLPSAGAAV